MQLQNLSLLTQGETKRKYHVRLKQVVIDWAHIIFRILNKNNEMSIHLSNNVVVIQTLGYIAIVAFDSHLVMKFCLKHFTFENV
jgi:hypothetical protein